ncbi:MAG: hypothetical protein J4F32_05765 [Dehalococcoidia bacterium]|nr:hypothetical protein [Dehalococcoidia bacterium]
MRLALPLLLLAAALAVGACSPDDEPAQSISASLLVEQRGEARWFRDVEVPKGTDGYEFLELATDGEVESDWYPEYRSHFVNAILGTPSESPYFWLTFIWNETSAAWEPLPIGADLFSVKEGHVLAWALLDTSASAQQTPATLP